MFCPVICLDTVLYFRLHLNQPLPSAKMNKTTSRSLRYCSSPLHPAPRRYSNQTFHLRILTLSPLQTTKSSTAKLNFNNYPSLQKQTKHTYNTTTKQPPPPPPNMSSLFSNTNTGSKNADPYTAKNADETSIEEKITDLSEFVSACKFGMMTTREGKSGALVSRCMALAAKVCFTHTE